MLYPSPLGGLAALYDELVRRSRKEIPDNPPAEFGRAAIEGFGGLPTREEITRLGEVARAAPGTIAKAAVQLGRQDPQALWNLYNTLTGAGEGATKLPGHIASEFERNPAGAAGFTAGLAASMAIPPGGGLKRLAKVTAPRAARYRQLKDLAAELERTLASGDIPHRQVLSMSTAEFRERAAARLTPQVHETLTKHRHITTPAEAFLQVPLRDRPDQIQAALDAGLINRAQFEDAVEDFARRTSEQLEGHLGALPELRTGTSPSRAAGIRQRALGERRVRKERQRVAREISREAEGDLGVVSFADTVEEQLGHLDESMEATRARHQLARRAYRLGEPGAEQELKAAADAILEAERAYTQLVEQVGIDNVLRARARAARREGLPTLRDEVAEARVREERARVHEELEGPTGPVDLSPEAPGARPPAAPPRENILGGRRAELEPTAQLIFESTRDNPDQLVSFMRRLVSNDEQARLLTASFIQRAMLANEATPREVVWYNIWAISNRMRRGQGP